MPFEGVKPGCKVHRRTGGLEIESMLNLSYDYISKAVPMIKDISYNFDTGRFVYGNDATGTRDVPQEIWADTAKSGRARVHGIGSNTLKRAALAHTILSKQRHDLLAQLSGFGGFSEVDNEARGVFYSSDNPSGNRKDNLTDDSKRFLISCSPPHRQH